MGDTTLKPDLTTFQDLSSDELSYYTTYARKFKLEGIYMKFSVPVTETITITLDAAAGVAYDTILRSRTLSAESNFVYAPEGGRNFQAGDRIRIQCTNANGVGIVYVTVKAHEVLS